MLISVTHQCEFNFWFILANVSVTRYFVKDPFGKLYKFSKKNIVFVLKILYSTWNVLILYDVTL